MCHNVRTLTTIYPPVLLHNRHSRSCSLCVFAAIFEAACRLHAPPAVLTFYGGRRCCPCVTFTDIPVLTGTGSVAD